MNNIIAVLNQEFEFTFAESFKEADYIHIFGGAAQAHTAVAFLDVLTLTIPGDSEQLVSAARTYLTTAGLDLDDRKSYLESFGISIESYTNKGAMAKTGVRVALDGQAFTAMLPAVDAMISAAADDTKRIMAVFEFLPHVRRLTPYQKLTARLIGCDVKFRNPQSFELQGVAMEVIARRIATVAGDYESARVSCRFVGTLSGSAVLQVLDLLFDRGVLYID